MCVRDRTLPQHMARYTHDIIEERSDRWREICLTLYSLLPPTKTWKSGGRGIKFGILE